MDISACNYSNETLDQDVDFMNSNKLFVFNIVIVCISVFGIALCLLFIIVLNKRQALSSLNLLMTIIAAVDIIEISCWLTNYAIDIISKKFSDHFCYLQSETWVSLTSNIIALFAHNINVCLTVGLAILQMRCVVSSPLSTAYIIYNN